MSFFNGGAVANEILYTGDPTHQLPEEQDHHYLDDIHDKLLLGDHDYIVLHHIQGGSGTPAQLVQPLLCCHKTSFIPASNRVELEIIFSSKSSPHMGQIPKDGDFGQNVAFFF